MREPRLSRPLTLERATRVADGAGGYGETWIPAGTVWAEVKLRSGREATGQNVSLSRVAYRITVRAAPQGAPSRPCAGERFRDGSRVFEIHAVTEFGPDMKYLACFAEEETAA